MSVTPAFHPSEPHMPPNSTQLLSTISCFPKNRRSTTTRGSLFTWSEDCLQYSKNDSRRFRTHVTIRKGVPMNLDMPWCVRFVWDHDLRFRIAEGNRKRVIRV